MKTKISIGECFAKTSYYSGNLTVIDENNEEEEFDFTISVSEDENIDNSFVMEVTFVENLPEGLNREEIDSEIIAQFNES